MVQIQTRAILWVLILTACLVSYMLRVNMSINLIAMIEPSSSADFEFDENGTSTIPLEDITPRQVQSECLAINDPNGNGSETHERLTALPDVRISLIINKIINKIII